MQITINIGDVYSEAIQKHVEGIRRPEETPEGTLNRKITVDQFLREQFLGSIAHVTGNLTSGPIKELEDKARAAAAAVKQAREAELRVSVSLGAPPNTATT